MRFKRRAFMSSPADEVLDSIQREIENGILRKIEEASYAR
jgi:hypothetical protein